MCRLREKAWKEELGVELHLVRNKITDADRWRKGRVRQDGKRKVGGAPDWVGQHRVFGIQMSPGSPCRGLSRGVPGSNRTGKLHCGSSGQGRPRQCKGRSREKVGELLYEWDVVVILLWESYWKPAIFRAILYAHPTGITKGMNVDGRAKQESIVQGFTVWARKKMAMLKWQHSEKCRF